LEAEVGNTIHTPTLLPGLAGHGAVLGAGIGGLENEAALLLCSDGTVLGCGRDKADDGTVLGRLPGAHLPEDEEEALALTMLPPLH
jgi:hypothetical protein